MCAFGAPAAPRVSVILPTYHWTSVLAYAIRTVLWQEFAEFELLVIGDGCTDDTADVVASFRDARIRWHNLPANTGNQAGPNNTGLAIARGQYIAYLHQDDLWLPDHLGHLVRAMDASDVFLAHTLCLEVSPPPDRHCWVSGLPGSGPFGADKVGLVTPAVMHSLDRARAVGGWRDWRTLYEPPTYDFWRRLLGPAQRLRRVPQLTVVKFHSADRKGSYMERRSDEQAQYFDRIRTEPGFRARELIRALEVQAGGIRPKHAFHGVPEGAPPGWEIEQYRLLRGLPPTRLEPDRSWQGRLRGVVMPALRRGRDRVPFWLRRPVSEALVTLGEFVGRAALPHPPDQSNH
jgi:glycosyltransferase involved in cell wall biosynthesis